VACTTLAKGLITQLTIFNHQPVLLTEVLQALNPQPGKTYVDGTLGGAGHAAALLAQQPQASLIGFDRDAMALAVAKDRLPASARLIQAPFAKLACYLSPLSITGGILLDLGVSSPQLDQADRGFSFMHNAPLDMRMDQASDSPTAAELLTTATETQLADWFKQYGEERLAKPIARAIKANLPTYTHALAELCRQSYRHFRIKEQQHPATRVFQALRIAVNGELDQLQGVLNQLPGLLAPGARVAIISFHSLEDRIVKQWMVQQAATCVCPPRLPVCQCGKVPTLRVLTKKPIMATTAETTQNPRARSAKLRVAEWIQ
jgi:16S rRNA (cytosine1402-N4)-methyltransferase